MGRGGAIARVALILSLLAAICLVPALLNGAPIIDTDVLEYARYADAAVNKLTGYPTSWLQLAPRYAGTGSGGAPVGDAQTIFYGRSLIYGLLVWLGPWPCVIIQAIISVAALLGVWRTVAPRTPLPELAAALIALALLTPWATTISILIPDSFTGLAVAGAAVMIVYGRVMQLWQLLAWGCLTAFALLMHDTHPLIMGGMLLVGSFLIHSKAGWSRGVIMVVACLIVYGAWQQAFSYGVTRAYGAPPIRPPFFSGRLIADGPGTEYLRATCPTSGYALCRYVAKFPMSAGQLEWEMDGGVFAPAPPEERRRIAAEDKGLALAVFVHDPTGVTREVVGNWLAQLVRFSAAFMNYSEKVKSKLHELPSPYLAAQQSTMTWRGEVPERVVSWIWWLSTAVAAGYLAFSARRWWYDIDLRNFAIVVAAGVLANDLICTISEVDDRYGSRVIWLIPMLALLAFHRRAMR
jgi:hypothetical protein